MPAEVERQHCHYRGIRRVATGRRIPSDLYGPASLLRIRTYEVRVLIIKSISMLFLLAGLSAPYWRVSGADDLPGQSAQEAHRKSEGCISGGCHVNTTEMHASPAVQLGCTD